MPNGPFDEKVVVVAPTIERPTGAGILAYEEDTAVLTWIGVAREKLPVDLPGLLNWHTEKVMAAAADDIVLTEAFMRVLQLLDPPVGLLRPARAMPVITGNRRRSRCG
ncbi:MAG: hypothetical protein QOJ80_215 [Mycobacterium sp.]|jgi:hypothetical protein|nr:hypothetical protein [Mycobacterium sp.]